MAHELTDNAQIDGLGKALGVHLSDIQRYIQTNQAGSSGRVTYTGTLKMLRDWQQTVEQGAERSILRKALITAKLVRVAENNFPKGT